MLNTGAAISLITANFFGDVEHCILPTKLTVTGAGQQTIELSDVESLQIPLCDVTLDVEFQVVPFLAACYPVLLGQDILSQLELIIDCGNGVVKAPGSNRIFASESIVLPAREGIHMEFLVPGVENGYHPVSCVPSTYR